MLVRSLLVLSVCLVASQLLSALPLDQETLLSQEKDLLTLESSNDVAVVREKRTVGFLRQLFPTLSQIIDRKIQAITRIVFRLIGRLVLRGGGGGGGGGGGDSGDDSDRRVQITLPSFPPSADDEDEDEDEDSTGASADDATTTTTEPSLEENSVAESNVVPVVARKRRQAVAPAADKEEEYEDDDQTGAATGDNEVASEAEEDTDDAESAESETNEDRNKRFLSLGGGSGSSGGGSGNFLFDIIRLVAGSGTTQNQDEADNAPQDENSTHSGKADDGYSAGVPGPLTRLFVIANRGIANLIQDLILRLAQTTERIVNFKARLITSII